MWQKAFIPTVECWHLSLGLTMRERHAIVRELAPRFRRATKKQRSQILDEFVKLTGYTRCYAAFVLRTCGSRQVRMIGTRRVIFIPGHARQRGAPRHRRERYGTASFLAALKRLWALSDGLCGKRLVAFIREIVPHLERQGSTEDCRPMESPRSAALGQRCDRGSDSWPGPSRETRSEGTIDHPPRHPLEASHPGQNLRRLGRRAARLLRSGSCCS